MTQEASLKVAVVVQEAERTATDASWNEAEQGRRCLDAECQSLQSTCAGESSVSTSCFHLVIVPGYGPVACLGLRAEALSDLEARAATE
jgi:hypothetical protein